MNITITKTTSPKTIPTENLGFGKHFTDHMFLMDYDREIGWSNARIEPFGRLSLHPAATVFHYGAEIFEGLKAYRRQDGKVQLFRPYENAKRMNSSAERLRLPLIDEDIFVEAVKELVKVDEQWVPSKFGESLYIRPFLFGNDESLGVHSIKKATFIIILSPSGSYYPEGINPVKIMIEKDDVRAVKGGTGYTKCGGNYAAANRAGENAEKKGYTQVLWLDGIHRKYIEEVGAMNVMFKIDGEIVTPELSGSILPGITRKSCLEVLRNEGYKVSERLLSIDELVEALKAGKLEEAWGCGTAAVVSPIGKLFYDGVEYEVNNNQIGEVTQRLYDLLTGIQWGKLEDKYGWTIEI